MTKQKKPETPPAPKTYYLYVGIANLPIRIDESLDAIVVGELESPMSPYKGTIYKYTEGAVSCELVGYISELQHVYLQRVADEVDKGDVE